MSPVAKVIAGLAVAAVAGGLFHMLSRDSPSSKGRQTTAKPSVGGVGAAGAAGASPSTPAPATSTPSTPASTSSTPRPTLPTPLPTASDAGTPVNAATRFADQPRDETWAPEVEARLERAARGIAVEGARVQTIECRESVCQLTVGGEQASMVSLVEKLGESPDLLLGSESLSLSRATKSDTVVTQLYLSFRR